MTHLYSGSTVNEGLYGGFAWHLSASGWVVDRDVLPRDLHTFSRWEMVGFGHLHIEGLFLGCTANFPLTGGFRALGLLCWTPRIPDDRHFDWGGPETR